MKGSGDARLSERTLCYNIKEESSVERERLAEKSSSVRAGGLLEIRNELF